MERESTYKPSTNWAVKQNSPEQEPTEDKIFFTLLRQQNVTAQQIGFVLKNQRHHAVPVSEIEEIYFEPEKGIFLFFRFGTVAIKGRNLQRLYRYLRDRRVIEIREFADNSALLFDEQALLIQSIHYESDNLKRIGMQ